MKVLFDLVKNQVSSEGDGPDLVALLQSVKDIAPKVQEIRLITGVSNATAGTPDETPSGSGINNGTGAPGLREFARSLAPANISERIVAIAAYKARFENTESFSPKEMGTWFMQCNFEKPSQMPVAIFDAKRKYGYLDKAGHGRWKLSTSGQNLVARRLEDARSNQE
jgi:hypothetical protein